MKQRKFTVIGVGSPIVDAIAQVDEAFVAQIEGNKGGMVLVDTPTITSLIERLPQAAVATPGGSAGNTVFALARMGVAARFLGKTGNCVDGGFYRERFAQLGGDCSRFKIAEVPNGRCLSLVTPDGERTMRTDLGAAMTLTPDEISPADFAGCEHAHIEGYLLFNEALMRRVLESARAAGCTISLDLASFEVVHAAKAILPELLRDYVDIVFANEEEGAAYTGIVDDYPAMALRLAELCEIAVIKVGARGSYVAHAGTVEKIEPVLAAHVLDTTGAGDLWAAGFLYGWSQKRSLAECAKIGSILGAAVVQEQGSVLPEQVWQNILETLTITQLVVDIARRARVASLELATLSTETKNSFLSDLAERLVAQTDAILAANALDLAAAKTLGLSDPMTERLSFTPARIAAMAEGVRQVAALPDPVGVELERMSPPKGFDLRKIRVPMGVIGIIYESRPNVTIDCAVLCLKSGNASILRGGKEAFHSNMQLAAIIQDALRANGIHEDAVQFIPTTDRAALKVLLKQDDTIHCIIPRGGESLIRFTVENSRIPVIKHYTGVCSVYIDAAADPEMAESILINSKCQRPSVCNAAENLIVHQDAAAQLPRLAKALHDRGVELRVDVHAKALLTASGLPLVDATPEDFATEYTDLIIAIALVPDLKAAIELINANSSGHTECIVTEDAAAARAFLTSVDSAAVFHNASTRFSDGFEFGLGAEIGISTDRLHARGPMGLNELCTYKYVIHGTGDVR